MKIEIHPDQTILTAEQVKEIIAGHLKNGGSYASFVEPREIVDLGRKVGGPNGALSEMRSGSGV